MELPVITPYAALLALIYIVLSVHTIRLRRRHGTALGSGEHDALTRAIRAHANFSEYVPFGLLLLGLLEIAYTAEWMASLLAAVLVISRAFHIYGLLIAEPKSGAFRYRTLGMAGTFSVLGFSAMLLLLAWVRLYFGFDSV